MKRLKRYLTLAGLFAGVFSCNTLIDPADNPLNPESPDYEYPTLSFDTLTLADGDTIAADSLTLVVTGNREENYFRWRMEDPGDTSSWSEWSGDGELTYTLTLNDIDTGLHVLRIQTTYHWDNDDRTDTAITFVKVRTPMIAAQSPDLIQSASDSPCTLWIQAAGTGPLAYQWFKDSEAVTGKNDDTLHFPLLLVADAGEYVCAVTNPWGSDTSAVIMLEVDRTNYAPQWAKDTLRLTVDENSLLDVQLADSCSDRNNDSLSFTALNTTHAGDSLYLSGRYTFSASYTDSGSYRMQAAATDGDAADTVLVLITVRNVNRKPVFADSLPQSVYQIEEGDKLSIAFKAADADGDAMAFFIKETNLPRKDEITLTDSLLQWQAATNDNNAYYLLLGVTDGQDTTVADIDIGVGSVNLPPRIAIAGMSSGGTATVREGDTLKLAVSVTDPNLGDAPVLLSAVGLPFSNTSNGIGGYDTASGAFWYVPDHGVSAQTKNDTLKGLVFHAADNAAPALQDSFALDIAVINVNRKPSVTLSAPTNGAQAVAKTTTFTWAGSDPDGDALTYTLLIGTLADQLEQVYKGGAKTFNDAALFGFGQKYYWKVAVADGAETAESVTRSFTVNTPPTVTLTAPANGATDVGLPVTLSWQGSDADAGDAGNLTYDVYLWEDGKTAVRVGEGVSQTSFVAEQLKYETGYRWYVVGGDGKDSSATAQFSFTTVAPAAITQHPQDLNVIVPAPATFNVTASGSGTFSYQWQRNGQDISGATDDVYTIPATSAADHGSTFRCIVDNGTGTPDTSNEAMLTLSFIVQVGASLHADVSPAKDTVEYGKSSSMFRVAPHSGWAVDGCYSQDAIISRNEEFTVSNVQSAMVIEVRCARWEYVGSPNLSDGDAFFVNMEVLDNQPIIAYQDVGNGRSLAVRIYDPNQQTWQNAGDASALLGTNVGGISLAVENNQPLIAVADPGFESKVTVIKLVGGSWQVVGSRGFSEYSTSVTDICVSSGVPYVAYVRSGFGDSRKLVVMRYNGGTWDYINESEISSKYAQNPKICVNSGRPYVAFQDWANNGKVSVKWNNGGGSWLPYGSPDEPDTVEENETVFLDMKFDNAIPYVFYQRSRNQEGGILKYESGNWTHLQSSPFSVHAWDISLDFFEGIPYISYMDHTNGAKATVMKWNRGTWVSIGKKGFTAESSYGTTIRVINGTPYLSYRSSGAHVMRYVTE